MAAQVRALVIGAALCLCGAGFAQGAPKQYSPAEYFKNYALSTCLADGYKAEEVTKDTAAVARGYLELGGFPLEAHTEATTLARAYLKREYKSISGEPLTLMKCIDFYHSRELKRLVEKYRKKK